MMKYRLAAILPAYLVVFAVCLYSALLLRFEFEIPARYLAVYLQTLPLLMVIKSTACWATGEWRRTYRYASLSDAVSLAEMTLWATSAIWLCNVWWWSAPLPRSVVVIDAVLSLLVLASLRIAVRAHAEVIRPKMRPREKDVALIYGVRQDSIGILKMLRALTSEGGNEPAVIGFVDQDSPRDRSLIDGLPIYREEEGWQRITGRTSAQHLLIPGSISGKKARSLLHDCTQAGLKVHVIPAASDMVEGRFKLAMRDLTISDLLRRDANDLDMASIREYVSGRRVMVTGAAGSIGSELCRQIRSFAPSALILLDQSEFGIFSMEQEFAQADPDDVELQYVMADIVDEATVDRAMREHQPEIIFHAAAYKHVPLMEDNPQAAVLNNVLGTKTLVDLADRHGIRRFVMISTDKAVRPTSVMGATKLLAEKYLQSVAATSDTVFCAVRFGNVLNSAGSVVPTFRKQIEAGGPITVTHPEMTRFFMTIPEAVQLVLQAGAIGHSGEVLILDMGEPVKIVDLAKDLILMSGLKYPDDIDIVFTGMRPGEKLYEELFYAHESGSRKVHEKIYSGCPEMPPPLPLMLSEIRRLEEAAYGPRDPMLELLREVVAGHTDSEWIPARLKAAA
jgi:FlaA1/EpsC-like NDP-sugar epimerase